MAPQLFGIEHILYILISTVVGAAALLLGKKYAVSEKAQNIFLKVLALLLLAAITANRLS